MPPRAPDPDGSRRSAELSAAFEASGVSGVAAAGVGETPWTSGSADDRYLVYSVTKTFISVLVQQLARDGDLALDDPVDGLLEDARLRGVTVRQLLSHTSGIPDYARGPDYAAAVRASPTSPWSDAQLVDRALAAGPDFVPGGGWAYSNTGYLLLRLLVERVTADGFAASLRRRVLDPLGLRRTAVAEEPDDLRDLVPGLSDQVGDRAADVRGLYHPAWVGHRALASTAGDLHRFWSALAAGRLGGGELADPRTFVEVGAEAPGFRRPCYGLGVMADPAHPLGVVIGHGGGGPGYGAACFATVGSGAPRSVAVVLSGRDGGQEVQTAALRLLSVAAGGSEPG